MELSTSHISFLLAAIGAIAFLYASVGHGGATGYLAAMALAGVSPAFARPGALWLNCVVAGIACWHFCRAGFFELRVFLLLAGASVPMAWLGSRFQLDQKAYSLILGITLLTAGYFLGWHRKQERETLSVIQRPLAVLSGGILGFISGLTGIGGGVFLTPLLIFLKWVPSKTAGGLSAAFIVVNSVAGLTGLGRKALIWDSALGAGPVIAALAAASGAYCGAHLLQTTAFRRSLAIVLWIAAAKLLLTMKG